MPGPLSETASLMVSASRSTWTHTTGATPAVSHASWALSTSSLRHTLANSSFGTPVSVESCRASKYSAARELSKVVRSNLGLWRREVLMSSPSSLSRGSPCNRCNRCNHFLRYPPLLSCTIKVRNTPPNHLRNPERGMCEKPVTVVTAVTHTSLTAPDHLLAYGLAPDLDNPLRLALNTGQRVGSDRKSTRLNS